MTPHPTDDRTDDGTDDRTDSDHDPAEDPATATRELTDDFDPRAPETFTSAHELYREMRTHCPVAHSEGFDGGFWALFRHSDVNRVLRDVDTFTTSVQNTVPKFAFTGRRPPLHLDPPEHTAYRRVINRFFTPTKMRALHPTVRELAVEQLTPLIQAGTGASPSTTRRSSRHWCSPSSSTSRGSCPPGSRRSAPPTSPRSSPWTTRR